MMNDEFTATTEPEGEYRTSNIQHPTSNARRAGLSWRSLAQGRQSTVELSTGEREAAAPLLIHTFPAPPPDPLACVVVQVSQDQQIADLSCL